MWYNRYTYTAFGQTLVVLPIVYFRPYVASIARIVLIPGREELPRAKPLSFNAVIKTVTLPTRYDSQSFDVVYSRHNPDMHLF